LEVVNQHGGTPHNRGPLVKEVTEDAADFFGDVAADALDDAAPSETPDGCFVMP
jgi:hypothetical protein